MSTSTTNFQGNFPRSPEPTQVRRQGGSIDRYGARSATAGEIPFGDPQARYSISYVPGMSEHVVNTGKTLPEAQLKVVLLACEVERLNTLNYNLVKENEILKAQARKTDREADLETKLAIVLAENEKLNQIVEELHSVYARERESLTNEDYERRIAELLQDLEEVKKQNPQAQVQVHHHDGGDLANLQRENDNLREELGRQGRDLAALRSRLADIKVGSVDNRPLQEQITALQIENEKLISELKAMKLQYGGNADALQQRLTQYDAKLRVLLSENEKLNNLLVDQSKELNALKNKPKDVVLTREPEERVVRAAAPQSNQKEIIERLAGDNKELSGTLNDLKEKLTRMARDNERLNDLVEQLRLEHENLRSKANDNTRINQLTVQINSLLDENRRLNDALNEKSRAYEDLLRKLNDPNLDTAAINDLRNRISALAAEIDGLNTTIRNLRAENENLRNQLASHTGGNARIDQLSVQLNTLLEENRRLNDLLAENVKRVRQLELEAGNSAAYRDKLQLITTENERLNAVINELRLHGGDSNTINELRSRINLLSTDNDNLRRQLAEAGSTTVRIETINLQLNNSLEENKKLNALLAERNREIDQLRLDINDLRGGSVRLEQLKSQLNSLLDENKRLNEGLLNKASEIDDLRRRNSQLEQRLGQINFLTSENERLTTLLTERLREVDTLRTRIITLEGSGAQINSLEDRIRGLNGERDRLNALLAERIREIDTLRVQIRELHGSSGIIESLRSNFVLLAAENERLNNQNNDRVRELDTLRLRVHELSGSQSIIDGLKGNLVLMTADNERLNGLLGNNLKEIDQLRLKIYQLEEAGRQANDLRSRVEILLADNNRLNAIIAEKIRETETQRIRILELESVNLSTADLQARLAAVTNDNQRLIQERDALRAQLTVATAERDRFAILLEEKTREIEGLRNEQIRTVERVSVETPKQAFRQSGVYTPAPTAQDETIANLENRIKLLGLEQQRLIAILAERDHEVEELKQRIKGFDALAQENDRLNRTLAEKIREIDELRRHSGEGHVSEADRARLESDYRRLLEVQISDANNRFTHEREELLTRIQELEARVHALTGDLDRLNRELGERGAEVNSWKDKHDQLERAKNAEIEQIRQTRTPVRPQPTGEEDQNELADKVDYLTNEIERLQEHLNNTLKELGEWRKRYSELEVLRAQEIDELRQQFGTVKKTQIDAKEAGAKFNAERAAYETQIAQLHQRVVDAERQVQLLSAENERAVRLSTAQLAEVEGQKRRQHELKVSQSLELAQLRSQIEVYKANASDVKQLAIKYSADKAADQSQIKQLKQVNENYKAEIEKLYELIEQRKTDFETLNKQNQELIGQYEKLTHQVFEQGTSASSNIEKFETLKKEVEELKTSRDDFKQQAERNSIELTRRNKDLIDRIQDLDILKMKYEEGLANYQALNTRLFDKLSGEK